MSVQPAHLEGAMSNRDAWTATRCSLDRTLQAIGSRSTLLLMREAFYGTTRFDDFAARVGITEAVAAARLRELVELGLLERRPYQDPGQRTRHEYVLTRAGADLLPAALALMQWGDRHLTGAAGAPVQVTHHGCGAPVQVSVTCAAGHEVQLGETVMSFTRRAHSNGGSVENTVDRRGT